MTRGNSFSDVRVILGLIGALLITAGAVLGAITVHKDMGGSGDFTIYLYCMTLLIPIFTVLGFAYNVHQLFAFALAFVWYQFVNAGFPSKADAARIGKDKQGLAALILLMIGALVSLAPMIKSLKLHKGAAVAFLLCTAFWLVPIFIFIIKYNDVDVPVEASVALLIFGLSVLRRSFSISILSMTVCVFICLGRMSNVISGFKANATAMAVGYLFHWLAATINIVFCAVDFHQSNVGDHIAHKDGGWSRLN